MTQYRRKIKEGICESLKTYHEEKDWGPNPRNLELSGAVTKSVKSTTRT